MWTPCFYARLTRYPTVWYTLLRSLLLRGRIHHMDARACCGVVQICVVDFFCHFAPLLPIYHIYCFFSALPALRRISANSVLGLAPLPTTDSNSAPSRSNCTQIVDAASLDNETPFSRRQLSTSSPVLNCKCFLRAQLERV